MENNLIVPPPPQKTDQGRRRKAQRPKKIAKKYEIFTWVYIFLNGYHSKSIKWRTA